MAKFHCSDCDNYNLCQYYHNRKGTSKICSEFDNTFDKTDIKTDGNIKYGNTYKDLYIRALSKLNLKEIDDWRPATPLYVDELIQGIPNAIIIWLKTGERIIYIEKS